MSMLTVYFFVMMDNVVTGLTIFAIASVVGCLASALVRSDYKPDTKVYKKASRWMVTYGIAMCIFGMMAVLTPNTKQFAAIYVIPKVVNNEDVRAMSNDAMRTLRLKFGEWLDDMSPKKVVEKAVEKIGGE